MSVRISPAFLQVVIRTLEEELPLDFGYLCLYEPTQRSLTVVAIGVASTTLRRAARHG